MGTFTDLVEIVDSGYGWILVTLVLLWAVAIIVYQIWGPIFLDKDTALAPIVRDVPEQLDTIEEQQREHRKDINELGEEMTEVKRRQEIGMQVDRAQARANPQMDHDRVDKYLLENGVEPSTFLKGDEMVGYSNWTSNDEDDNTKKGHG
jgi:hypothetical protein